MAQVSAEAVLISALLNNQEVRAAATYGITAEHFLGYHDEFTWLLNYIERYGTEPTKDAFSHTFPYFRFSEHEDIRSACDLVLKAHNKQRLNMAMSEAVDLLGVGDETAAYNKLVAAEPRRASAKPRRLLTDTSFLDNWDEPRSYVEVPYRTLQLMTGGIQPGNLWYLAARPGQGKTAHLCNIAKHAVLTGNRVLFYSLEMSEMEVRARFHAAMANHWSRAHPEWRAITVNSIRDRSVDLHLYKTFVGELDDKLASTGGSLDIHTPRDGTVSPSVVASRAADYHLNIIDYIGLMRADSGDAAVQDWRIAAQISNSLKEIGLSQSTAMLCAAQINREGDNGTSPPKVKNLAQSDALGQDGDVVITMRCKSNVATALSLEKNRHGSSGVPFYTTFEPNIGVYREINAEQAESLAIEQDASHD